LIKNEDESSVHSEAQESSKKKHGKQSEEFGAADNAHTAVTPPPPSPHTLQAAFNSMYSIEEFHYPKSVKIIITKNTTPTTVY
jgi:hypothetical protein